jgi:hypothetical protein
MIKKEYGQFYTTNAEYIIGNLLNTIPENVNIIDPFAGNVDLINLLMNKKIKMNSCILYDIDPKTENTIKKDTLLNPPDYNNKWVITNPPYLARNKNKNKELYDLYNLNDLYKISLKTIIGCEGGIIIIPLNFFSNKNSTIRNEFLSKYKILNLNVFEESVFDDTSYTVCSFSFIKNDTNNDEQIIDTTFFPTKEKKTIVLNVDNNYLFGADFFNIINHNNPLSIKRLTNYSDNKPNSYLFIRTIDTGTIEGKINLSINKEYFYGKETDRTFATIILPNEYSDLTIEQQENICLEFNNMLNNYRDIYHSLFLTNYRNSTSSYSRKRIGFDVVYKLISYILKNKMGC